MNVIKSDFVFLGLAILAALVVVSGLGGRAVMAILGYEGLSMAEVLARNELNAARAILAQQGLGSMAYFLIPSVVLFHRWSRQSAQGRVMESPELQRGPWSRVQTLMALALIPAMLPALDWVTGNWVSWLRDAGWAASAIVQAQSQSNLVERVLFLPQPVDQLLALIVLVVLAPVGEEFFFRGSLQRMLRTHWGVYSVVASALLFAGFHFDVLHLPFLVVAGLTLSWLYERSGRLYVPVGAHVLHNAITYLQTQRLGPGSYADLSPTPWSWLASAGLLAAISLFVALRRR